MEHNFVVVLAMLYQMKQWAHFSLSLRDLVAEHVLPQRSRDKDMFMLFYNVSLLTQYDVRDHFNKLCFTVNVIQY